MKVKWYVTYTMRQIKKEYQNALYAASRGDMDQFYIGCGRAQGQYMGLYAVLVDTDKHLAKLFSRWCDKQRNNLYEARAQVR